MNYGKLNDFNALINAPSLKSVNIDGNTYYIPYTEEEMAAMGYKPVELYSGDIPEGKHIEFIDNGEKIVETLVDLPEEYKLYSELNSCYRRLSELDYIGTKIATGRATADEYKDEIEEMKTIASKINEIKEKLKNLN